MWHATPIDLGVAFFVFLNTLLLVYAQRQRKQIKHDLEETKKELKNGNGHAP